MLLAAGAISSAPRVAIGNQSPSNVAGDAAYALESDGDVAITDVGGADRDVGDWITPKSFAGAAYETRATLNSGTLKSGSSATGSWLALSSTRKWSVSTVELSANLTIEIRRASDSVVLDSATVVLSASPP